ncbi:hypothetical protein SAMN05444280_10796 [Tangfeifania diversioriginum]|uniref:Right handed beta helix region n=1 Tax=Tangfeifania diversioriginum TaxID=1168035 RepID=A0A1M6ERM8_9BACT|nr:hypothetical protein [Tangfeifania diversioriginum]SHI88157.1 hypothetical protein SAMN05444280_10796 [Tangfeifania diversioriginum]
MKKLFTFLAATFVITTLHAKIVYLNNNLESPIISENVFINWSDAYAAVSDGDTIYVTGSNINYGDVTIDKPLTLIGPGYYLDQKMETQINKRPANFGGIILASGSNNSKIVGIVCPSGGSYEGIFLDDGIDNITIESCFIPRIDIEDDDGTVYNNIQIKKCYIWRAGLQSGTGSYDNGICTNLVFSNNLVVGTMRVPGGSDGVIIHNLFMDNNLYFGSDSNLEISNNIYLNEDEDDFTIQPLPDVSVHHNVSLTGAFGNENDNFSAPQSTLFISGSDVPDTDAQYQLSENSPAKGAGTDGTDIGPFGGPDPYRLSGLPNLPNIYELSTGGFVSGDEMSVQIKIKQ